MERPQKKLQTANKYFKKCSRSTVKLLVIREMKTKTPLRFHLTPVRTVILMTKQMTTHAVQSMENTMGTLTHSQQRDKLVQTMGIRAGIPQTSLSSCSLLLHLQQRRNRQSIWKDHFHEDTTPSDRRTQRNRAELSRKIPSCQSAILSPAGSFPAAIGKLSTVLLSCGSCNNLSKTCFLVQLWHVSYGGTHPFLILRFASREKMHAYLQFNSKSPGWGEQRPQGVA